MMARTCKALSALLSYPGEELQAAACEIGRLIRDEQLVDAGACDALQSLLDSLAISDLFDLQEQYVELFDKTRRLSLHLFEHVHGEGRDRGQAMVDLASLYERSGLAIAANELPDYLPLFLEYLSTRPVEEARAQLADTLPILAAIEQRLQARKSVYAAAFTAIRSVAGDRTIAAADPAAAPEPADDLAALDAAWEETAVTFGQGSALDSCPASRLQTRLRAAAHDPTPWPTPVA